MVFQINTNNYDEVKYETCDPSLSLPLYGGK